MGAHTAPRTAPRTATVGRIAGRGALTAAAAIALTGGTASFAFAGTSEHEGYKNDDCGCSTSWHDKKWDDDKKSDDHDWKSDDDKKSDDHDWKSDDHDWKSDDHDWKSDDRGWKSDDDCDDDHGRDHHRWDDKDDDHGKWDKKDHQDRGGRFGARYENSTHNGDDIYTVKNVTNSGLLAGVL